jgi:glucokinase
MILAGDIGGTHARLAFVTSEDGRFTIVTEASFPSREHASLEEVLDQFLSDHRRPVEQACFGVAGPVRGNRSDATNLPWVVDGRSLAKRLRLDEVRVINDLEATAYGIGALAAEDFLVLQAGTAGARGNTAVIAAGTGLGEAGLYWDGRRHHPFATEGGHADFAPQDALQTELLQYLRTQFDHVSYERVLSGPGLFNIYRFLRDAGRAEEPAWLAGQLKDRDPSPVITRVGLEGTSELCVRALDLFVSVYGAEAGNLAQKLLATGGVYVGGGIAPQILPKLKTPIFRLAFLAKGRMQPLLEAIPVRVILNEKAGLLGAARCAFLSGTPQSPPSPGGGGGLLRGRGIPPGGPPVKEEASR